jgi:hypothetical protein
MAMDIEIVIYILPKHSPQNKVMKKMKVTLLFFISRYCIQLMKTGKRAPTFTAMDNVTCE